MNNTEKQFIEILSKAIRNDRNIDYYEGVKWSNLINLAGEHKVEGIIYPLIAKNSLKFNIDNSLLEELKKFSFYTAISEVRKISYLENIFKEFEQNNIKVIALNGLILRKFYPQPEQRSMYDIDLLVYKDDIKRVTDILKAIEYDVEVKNKSSIRFVHRLYPIIEIHWQLVNGEELDNSVWNRLMKDKILNTEISTLGYEDFLVYIVNNIINNINKNGLLLRQFTDIVLFVEANEDKIDWTSFKVKIKEQGIEKFVLIIFSLCNILFELELPEVLLDRDIKYSPNIDILIENLLLGRMYEINNSEKIVFNAASEDYSFLDNIKKFIRSKKLDKNRDKIIRWLGI